MINTENTDQTQEPNSETPQDHSPDEHGGIHVQAFLKIHDPESGEIILQGRA